MYFIIMLCYHAMSKRPVDSDNVTARVLKHNEKLNVPIQTEKEEAEKYLKM
jgi:hypothetical protein